MDVELLRTFIEVQQTRHFGRAAENLFITQSAVSARIRQLEDELGVRLFMRDRNNIQLTTAGQKLLRHAEAIIANWNRARLDVAVGDDSGQHITMAALPNLWAILIPDWLQWVQRQHGDVAISADALGPESILRRVLDRSLDFGLLFEPPRLPELTVTESCRFRLLLVSSQPQAPLEQALGLHYIYVDWGGDFAHQHAQLFPDAPAPGLRLGLGAAALELLASGAGAAYLAEPQVQPWVEAGRLFPVPQAPVIERQVYAVYRQDTDRREIIETLSDLSGRIDKLQKPPLPLP
ncbi:DNA-binding transcriptional LysR family regulator [Methylohalomonas lacus]|uniref:DNA-binding transcriptional LysR family regulator n=1 Tax=Methylohalomonas lacus TaxID=398773 RepID=A0AAE3HM20_9GAMM|nr:LysR family transcriptional regulator [Methylohalomonas lacus]MCS3903614.1 DNA-binding transcriptional LysR family regulator [Methylohalomonas lacus]